MSKILHCAQYPQYAVQQQGQEAFVSSRRASCLLSEGAVLGQNARDSDGEIRPITPDERTEITQQAQG